MSTENTVDKVKLISELKEIHSELFQVYKKLFDFKYNHDEEFKLFIDKEHEENGVGSKEKKAWNDNFCHRASYTLLNKILFVRICEDKGFMRNAEDYIAGEVKDLHIGEKLSKVGLQKWGRLITNYTLGELIKFAFNDMKQSYSNIVLYKEDKYEILNPRDEEFSLKYIDGDKDTKDLVLEFENVLNNIIEKLDTNNFNFKYTDGNILGDVYEKFMDRETRKAIGQFYTPEFVIQYILKNTVKEADILENPFVTVADISCGSGHFLIMAYDILREKFLSNLKALNEKYADESYTIKKDGKQVQISGREYWVKEHVHYHILKNCIFGADIDSFAVQLTTINLLLKDLDNFTDELNIIECDSLIKWEKDYEWQGLKEQLEEEFETVVTSQTNLFGEEEKFEKTVRKENYKLKYKDTSNIKREELISKEKAEETINICEFWNNNFDYIIGNPPYIPITQISVTKKEYYRNNYTYSEGRINTFSLFIERVLINKNNKHLGYIIPSRILLNTQYVKIRELLLLKTEIRKILDLSEGIFEDAVVDTIVIMVNNNLPESNIVNVEKFDGKNLTNKKVLQNTFLTFDNSYINIYIDEKEIDVLNKIKNKSIKLESIADVKDGIIQGAVGDLLFLNDKKIDSKYCTRVLFGENIRSYIKKWKNEYINYNKDLLTQVEDERTKGKGRGLRLRNPEIFERPKILTRQTSDRIIAAVDIENYYYMNTLHGTFIEDKNYDIYYVLAVLNSSVMNFYYTRYNFEVGKTFAQVKIENLKSLPIMKLGYNQQEYISKLSKDLVELNKEYISLNYIITGNKYEILNSFINVEMKKSIIKSQISEKLIDIDFYLYNILNLTKEEIELIESVNLNFTKERKYLVEHNSYEYDSVKRCLLETCKNDINFEKFIKLMIQQKKTVENICEEYNYEYVTLHYLRDSYLEEVDKDKKCYMFNINDLLNEIYNLIWISVKNILRKQKKYRSIDDLNQEIKEEINNYDSLIEVIRSINLEIKTKEILKNAINLNKYTWKLYNKSKDNLKSLKIVEYYDSNYYGIAEWSDEIHKQYFMDAIDEYTVNSPNEKKAKDILKLFKELEIEDKEDYIDIIEDKIKKAFS